MLVLLSSAYLGTSKAELQCPSVAGFTARHHSRPAALTSASGTIAIPYSYNLSPHLDFLGISNGSLSFSLIPSLPPHPLYVVFPKKKSLALHFKLFLGRLTSIPIASIPRQLLPVSYRILSVSLCWSLRHLNKVNRESNSQWKATTRDLSGLLEPVFGIRWVSV